YQRHAERVGRLVRHLGVYYLTEHGGLEEPDYKVSHLRREALLDLRVGVEGESRSTARISTPFTSAMTGLSKLSGLLAGKVMVASSRKRSSSASTMPDFLAS